MIALGYMENENKKKSSLVQFRVSGQERVMLDQLLARFGSMVSEYMRSLIREKHAKVFPAYTMKGREKALEIDPVLTPEQACEAAGGKVETVNGIPTCVIQISRSMAHKLPLSSPDIFKLKKK